jgi:WD40 repeat protein
LVKRWQTLWNKGDVKAAFADVSESFVAVQARTEEPSPYDVSMDRSTFAKYQATQYSSNPPPRLHVFWDKMKVEREGDRATVSWIEIAKFQEMTFRYQCVQELEKEDTRWFIVKQRYWELDWRIDYKWTDSGPAHFAAKDKKVAQLQQENSPELPNALLSASRFNEAYELTSKVAESRPDDAENWVMLGEAAINVGKIGEGIDALAKARTIDPVVEMPWFLTRIESNFSQHRSASIGVDINTEQNQMVTAHQDQTLVFWNLKTEKVIRKLESAHSKAVSDVAYLHDGKRVISSGFDGVVNVFDLSTGDRIGHLSGHLGVIWRMDLHPTKNIVITTSADRTAKIWDVDRAQELVSLSGHTRGVFGAAFNPDGSLAVTSSRDGTLRIWDTATGNELKKIDAHRDGAWRVDWTPDGERIISVGRDKMVRVWDGKTYEPVTALEGHTDFIEVIRIAPDGKLAATGDNAGEIWMWNLQTLKPVTVLRSYAPVFNLRFLHQSLLSVHADQVTRRWDVNFSTPFLEKKIQLVEGL